MPSPGAPRAAPRAPRRRRAAAPSSALVTACGVRGCAGTSGPRAAVVSGDAACFFLRRRCGWPSVCRVPRRRQVWFGVEHVYKDIALYPPLKRDRRGIHNLRRIRPTPQALLPDGNLVTAQSEDLRHLGSSDVLLPREAPASTPVIAGRQALVKHLGSVAQHRMATVKARHE